MLESVGGIAGIVSALAALAGVAMAVFKFFSEYRARRTGRLEAENEAAKREAARAQERARIDSDVRRLDPDGLTDELRKP